MKCILGREGSQFSALSRKPNTAATTWLVEPKTGELKGRHFRMSSVLSTCLMRKKEKKESRKSNTAVTVRGAHRLPDPPQPEDDTEQLRATGSEQCCRGGEGAEEKSEVVSPFPITRETNALSKKSGQWQTPAIVFRQKVT
ncbi:unnamed protein product [Pleuronectes platessa]|uniref:Uncharacterized protein n=1 Tax=Pleuronectes platessa TaxID=8262 RepID=A0A9N7YTV6_PLEPL|nr:unnamed protein product [Pleuronectes platessa]